MVQPPVRHDEAELAEAIRFGAKRRPEQAFGEYYEGRRASCALGAAYEGMYRLPEEVGHLHPKRLERLFETGDVHGVAALASHELGEIDRKAVGVVEAERILTADRATDFLTAPGRMRRRQLIEAGQATFDRRQESLFLHARRVEDVTCSLLELGIHATHRIDHSLHDVDERRSLASEQPGMARLFKLNEKWPYPLMPSDYVKRQFHVSFQDDPVALACRHITGVSSIVWGNDYPHAEGTFRGSQELIAREFAGVPDDERAAILGGTLAGVLGFE